MWGQCRIFQNFIPDRWLNVAASTLLSFQQVFQVLPGTCNYLRFSQALHAWRCDLLTEQQLLWDCNGLTTKLVRVRKGGSQWRKVQDSAWKRPETSLEVQWLTLQAPSAGGAGSIAGRGLRDTGSIPGSTRSPGGGHGKLPLYSCLENLMEREAWLATVHRITQSRTRQKQLSMHTCYLR